MVVSTAVAALGSAALGFGGSVIASRRNSRAIDASSRAQNQASQQQTQLFRDIFNQQTETNAPFLQNDLDLQNLRRQFFGLSAIEGGDTDGQAGFGQGGNAFQGAGQFNQYVNDNPDVRGAFQGLSQQDQASLLDRGVDQNRDGRIDQSEFGAFHFREFGQGEGRQLSGGGPESSGLPSGEVPTGLQGEAVDPTLGTTGNPDSGLQQNLFRTLQGTPFFQSLQQDQNREGNAIDSSLSARGLALSGANLQAKRDSFDRLNTGALTNAVSALFGQPNSGSAQANNQAASQFAANTGNAFQNRANTASQSAFARAGNSNQLLNNIFQVGSNALGSL